MPIPIFLQSLLCRTDTAPRIDPLPAGYSSTPLARSVLGPTFVPLQLPPDGHMDPDTFKDITEAKLKTDLVLSHMRLVLAAQTQGGRRTTDTNDWNLIYNCIRDYSEQILTRWLNTYANHTAALRQLQQAGLYPPQHVASGPHRVGDQTMYAPVKSRSSQYVPPPLIRQSPLSVPISAQSKGGIPPPLPEKTKPFPSSRPTSSQFPLADKPLAPLKYGNPRPRPASWQAMPETTGALFKALKRLSESEGLIPQEYAQLLERASRQEVSPTENQPATGDSIPSSPLQSYTPAGSVSAVKITDEHKKTIRRIRPPSRDTASRHGADDGNNTYNHLNKTSPTTSNTPISYSGNSTPRLTPTAETFSQGKVNDQPIFKCLPTPPPKIDIISLAPTNSVLETPGLTPLSQKEPFPIREPHPTPTELTQRDSKTSRTPPPKSPARVAANLVREKAALNTAPEAISLQPPDHDLPLYANVNPGHTLLAENESVNVRAPYTATSEETKPEIHIEVPTPNSVTSGLTPLSETEPISIREPHPTPIDAERRDLQNALTPPPPKALSAASTPCGGYKTPDGSPVKAAISGFKKLVEKAKSSREPVSERTEENAKARRVVQEVVGSPQLADVVDCDGKSSDQSRGEL
ncbi:hypothetical protein CNBD5960 [Cryptococcus deneoformans B-3501A]|uniref:hypothetical protein n=1 Tax=Cryptococcus deneoformans (strain B-3501A) TaxID=283643 RepID=UPI000042FE65|nr:hypothetical protein CNBD5960 [Cryptococcus neoformans var. neoformans B-3501A]EAL20995.1 hypothetical protein CNBD5960 [Cryptococcus neoformans var. neoformans B-3501A]